MKHTGAIAFFNNTSNSSFATRGPGTYPSGYNITTILAASSGAYNFSLNTSAATKIFKSRVNGSNVTPTGVLNNSSAALTSQILYVGSRSGSTSYSNMKCYSIVGIGRNLTTIESNLIEGIQTEPFV